MGKRLYVGNLPYDTDEASLKEAFGQDGRQVQNVHIVMDRDTNRPRGFAFVEMVTEEDAKKAIVAWDGKDYRGRMLRVNEAEDRRPARGPGGPGGPRSGAGGPRPEYRGAAGGGGGAPADAGSVVRRNFGADAPPADQKRYPEKKAPRRKHDEDQDFGGRRGSRRFDDDEE